MQSAGRHPDCKSLYGRSYVTDQRPPPTTVLYLKANQYKDSLVNA